ncbi:uncharacterized protein LOC144943645 isoform X2 [Lampetra fluviatilis]
MSTHNGSPAGWSGRARRGGGSLGDSDVKENGGGGDGGQEEDEEDEWSLLSEEERECLRYFDATVESAAAPEPPGEGDPRGDPQGDPRRPREARRSVHHHNHHPNQKHHENGLGDEAAVMRSPRESGGHAGRQGTPPGTPPGTPATPGSLGEGDAELGAEEMAALRYLDASIRHGEQELRDFPDPAGMAPEARAGLPEGSGGDADPRSRRPYLFPRPSVRLPDGRPSGAETASRGRGRSEGDERNEDDERRDDEGNVEDKAEEVDEVTDVSTGPHRVRAQLRTTGTRGVDEEGGDGTRGLGRGGGGGGSGAGCGRVGGGGGGCGGGGDGMRADVARADVARADGERGDGGRGGCGDGRPNGGGGAQRLENQGPGVEAERCRGTGVVRRCSVKFPAGPGQDHARQEALARLGLLKKDSVGKGDPRGPRSPQCGPRGPARAPSPGAPLSPGPSSPTGSASPTSPTGPTGPLGHAGDGSRGPGRAGRSPPHGQQGQRPGLRPSGITVHFSPRGRAAEEEHREALRKLGLLKA